MSKELVRVLSVRCSVHGELENSLYHGKLPYIVPLSVARQEVKKAKCWFCGDDRPEPHSLLFATEPVNDDELDLYVKAQYGSKN